MQPLNASRPAQPQSYDPSPSIWSYRFQRLWLTPFFRRLISLGVPAFFMILFLGWFISDDEQMQGLTESVAEMRREIEGRPEFLLNVMGIEGASPALSETIRTVLSIDFPISSFDLELVEVKARIEDIPAVLSAEVRVLSGGYLSVVVEEREPVVVWQRRDAIVLLDQTGAFVADISERDLSAPLPMIAGEGADLVVDEALALIASAAPISDRLQGLVRMGERRWDVILSDGRKIMLPEENASFVLDRVIALDQAQDILSRDILSIDMRRPDRPTLRLSGEAKDNFDMLRGQLVVSGERQG